MTERRPTALIADDEPLLRKALTRALARITEVLAACIPPRESEHTEPSARSADDAKRGID